MNRNLKGWPFELLDRDVSVKGEGDGPGPGKPC
jgi:hypothetical protein